MFPLTMGLTSRAVAFKKTVSGGGVAQGPDYLIAFASTQSESVVPIVSAAGGSVIRDVGCRE